MIARFRLTAPLSHSAFGADAGNAVPLRRMRVVSLPGYPEVPAVSGNALRGSLRRALARELFQVLGLGPETPGWDRLYAAIANGGTIEAAEKRIDPARIRHFRETLPVVSVLGAAMYKWLLSGHLRAGIVWPVCRETVEAGLVSPRTGTPGTGEIEGEYTAARLPEVETASPESTGVGPMPVTVEVIATGTIMESRLGFASHAPEIERAAIAHGLTLLTHLGGKSGSGLGCFALEIESEVDPQPYRDWLSEPVSIERAQAAIAELKATF
jgi:hypothetical protein